MVYVVYRGVDNNGVSGYVNFFCKVFIFTGYFKLLNLAIRLLFSSFFFSSPFVFYAFVGANLIRITPNTGYDYSANSRFNG
jgi:hypothetical protein